MSKEQEKQMYRDFVDWYTLAWKSLPNMSNLITQAMYQGFQAAYTPRPTPEVVAGALHDCRFDGGLDNRDGWLQEQYMQEAQSVIDVIFSKRNV